MVEPALDGAARLGINGLTSNAVTMGVTLDGRKRYSENVPGPSSNLLLTLLALGGFRVAD